MNPPQSAPGTQDARGTQDAQDARGTQGSEGSEGARGTLLTRDCMTTNLRGARAAVLRGVIMQSLLGEARAQRTRRPYGKVGHSERCAGR
jgi:hypothetical protein